MGKPDRSEVQRITQQLASVRQEMAKLLLSGRYDEAELAELVVRARELGELLAVAAHGSAPPVVETRNAVHLRSPFVSGG